MFERAKKPTDSHPVAPQDARADVNASRLHAWGDVQDKWTALHFAADDGDVETARVLMAKGADIEARDVVSLC